MSETNVRVFQRGAQFFTAADDGEFWPSHKAPMRVMPDDPDAAQHAKAWFLAWTPATVRLAWVDPEKLIANLDDLLARVRGIEAVRCGRWGDEADKDERDYCIRVGLPVAKNNHCDFEKLPTFGGKRAKRLATESIEVLSWDPDRLLVNFCDSGKVITIIARDHPSLTGGI